jgi:hypothetical protein
MYSQNRFCCFSKAKFSVEVKEIAKRDPNRETKDKLKKENKKNPRDKRDKTSSRCNTKMLDLCRDRIIKEIRYPNGDIYNGEIESDKKNGIGKMIFANGNIFEGTWENDSMKYGKMIYIESDNDVYEGEVVNNKCHGNGIYISRNFIMKGQWNNDKIVNGILDYKEYDATRMCEFEKNYLYYDGKIEDDLPEGNGKMIFRNGDVYIGMWKNGEIYGNGKMEYKNGNVLSYYKTFNHKNQFAMLTTKRGENYLVVIKDYKKIHDMIKIPKTIKSVCNVEKDFNNFEIKLVEDKSNITENEIDTITCPISFTPMLEPVITNCGHTFCKYSLQKLNGKCALCRSNIEYFFPNDELDEIYEKCKFSYSNCDGFMTVTELRNILRFVKIHKIDFDTNLKPKVESEIRPQVDSESESDSYSESESE